MQPSLSAGHAMGLGHADDFDGQNRQDAGHEIQHQAAQEGQGNGLDELREPPRHGRCVEAFGQILKQRIVVHRRRRRRLGPAQGDFHLKRLQLGAATHELHHTNERPVLDAVSS